MDATCIDSAELVQELREQLKASENLIAHLRHEKEGMEADFDHKRSKIKDLYYAKEITNRELNAKLFEAGRSVSELEETVRALTEEIENVKMIAAVSENTKEEAVEEINKRHQEEIESLRHVLRESMEEQRHELMAQFKQERRHWELELHSARTSVNQIKEDMNSSGENPNKDSLLGLTMEAAQSEAEALKAVVLPLEAEIAELKAKLARSEESLELQRLRNKEFTDSDASSDSLDGVRFLNKTKETDTCRPLSPNSFSHDELENHIENLTKQKLILQRENDTLKGEMHEVCRSLEEEMSNHFALSETWKAANEQFLTFQQLHMKDMEIIQQFVTEEQWTEIQQKIKKEANHEESKMTVDSFTNQSSSNTETRTLESDEFLPFQSHQTSTSVTNESLSTITELQDNISVSSVSSLPGTTSLHCPTNESIKTVFSAPHINLLASDNSTEESQRKSTQAWDEIVSDTVSSNSVKSIEESSKTQNMTDSKVSELLDQLLEQQKINENEKAARLKLEAEIDETAAKAQSQIKELAVKISSLEQRLDEDKRWRKSKETEDIRRLTLLQRDRERVYSDFQLLKKENSSLKAAYENYRIDLSKEPIVPMTVEGLRIQVQKYREALLGAQVEKRQIESQLQSRISFTEDCLSAEQTAKDQLEKALNSDLDVLRAKLSSLQEIRSRQERELTTKKELEALYEKEQLKSEAVRSKSKDIIKDLKEKLKNETKTKEDYENKFMETKNQVRSLQESLETSEMVQQDFVRLSQSLQMQLEEIRLRDEVKASSSNPSSADSSPPTNHNPG